WADSERRMSWPAPWHSWHPPPQVTLPARAFSWMVAGRRADGRQGIEMASFAWGTPATFNFGTDVVDRLGEVGGTALIWENQAGDSRSYSFAEIASLTNRLANALRERSIGQGDRVIVMLPRVPAWPVSIVALLKIGAVPVPCIEMLTERDLAFRIENSGAK